MGTLISALAMLATFAETRFWRVTAMQILSAHPATFDVVEFSAREARLVARGLLIAADQADATLNAS
jgi:hypothetical protein